MPADRLAPVQKCQFISMKPMSPCEASARSCAMREGGGLEAQAARIRPCGRQIDPSNVYGVGVVIEVSERYP